MSTDMKISKLFNCMVVFTFHNPYLRPTVTELQQFRDVFIRNAHVGISLVTVEGGRSFLPFSQIYGTYFGYKDRKGISVQGSLNNSEVIFQLFDTFKERCNLWK